jgi:membrane-associated phospholipid phosphatase
VRIAESFATACVALVAFTAAAAPARAQSPSTQPPAVPSDQLPSFVQLFTGTVRDFKKLPTLDNLGWLAAGGVVSLATHEADAKSTSLLAGNDALREPFKAGAVLGGTPFELGAAFAAYGAGRAFKQDRLALVGADLVRAELMAEALAIGVKQAARRDRPSGSGFSFPSGHTTASFAAATVLQRHFGWKLGIPAYALASYVGASRIQNRRHYLSDVTFGAALGIIAGRTATLGRQRSYTISPVVTPDTTGVLVRWIRP